MPAFAQDRDHDGGVTLAGPAGAAPLPGRTMPEAPLTRLYREYGRALLGYAQRYTLDNHHDAEELVQEALLRAWRHPEILGDAEMSPLPWLRKVIRNLAIDRLRAQGCRPQTMTDAALAGVPNTEEPVEQMLTSQVIRAVLATLKPIHREVLYELYFLDRSVAETSTRLGVPSGTVKSRSFHALRALRAALVRRGLLTDTTGPDVALVRPATSIWTARTAGRHAGRAVAPLSA
jgi:RNA polymerase sigma-70 factor, ECF subfamily